MTPGCKPLLSVFSAYRCPSPTAAGTVWQGPGRGSLRGSPPVALSVWSVLMGSTVMRQVKEQPSPSKTLCQAWAAWGGAAKPMGELGRAGARTPFLRRACLNTALHWALDEKRRDVGYLFTIPCIYKHSCHTPLSLPPTVCLFSNNLMTLSGQSTIYSTSRVNRLWQMACWCLAVHLQSLIFFLGLEFSIYLFTYLLFYVCACFACMYVLH